ncbi:MAG: hypothetical protein C0498_05580 [Anaerolinea sp.]|nr:hypothetical protein [Anaerolinea sp.]
MVARGSPAARVATPGHARSSLSVDDPLPVAQEDKMSTTAPEPWPWPEALDGPQAAADNHRVLFENDRVRVLETVIGPGETTPLHTHRCPTVSHVVSGSSIIRRDEHGAVLLDTSKVDPPFVMPRVLWSDFLPAHTLENTGPDDLVVIGVELKDRA